MHVYFSGMGGAGIGPLALIARQAGFTVSGSDKRASGYTKYLQNKGLEVHIGQQDDSFISQTHKTRSIDWFVYSSALPLENPNHPELTFAKNNRIKHSKRDEFLSYLLRQKNQKMIAVAGTHGKTTTTAMLIWLLKNLDLPISYSLGAKTVFAEMGNFNPKSEFFIYECDEFDKNFLTFWPFRALIPSVDWDHHEIYPTRDSYKAAFKTFIAQAALTYLYEADANYLNLEKAVSSVIINDQDVTINDIKLPGLHNRKNAFLCVKMVADVSGQPIKKMIEIINDFPGSSRRFEKLTEKVYTDYAHSPTEVKATLQLASEVAKEGIVAVYEPLTDRRQHYMKNEYKDVFEAAEKIYWLPSYLAREDPSQTILKPETLIASLQNSSAAESAQANDDLKRKLDQHLANGKLVVFLAGGGGGSLDDWARHNFQDHKPTAG